MITRICNECGVAKESKQLVRSDLSLGGYRPLCKSCKNKQQSAQRKARAEREVLEAKEQVQEAKMQRQVDPLLALPRTFATTEPYKPEPAYYRNNGLKDIPSRGDGC